MERALKVTAIGLCGALVLTYVAAKIHFFTRFNGHFGAYATEHWPYWAGMVVIGGLILAVGALARHQGVVSEGEQPGPS